MGYLKWLALIILLVTAALYVHGENIRFEHISNEQGLSQVSVNSIMQDRQGFMWFGTQDGLNRYDGYEFKIYRPDPMDKTSISDNYIWCILEDHSGILWIGTNGGGLNMFDRETECFYSYKNAEGNPGSISHNEVSVIFEDHEDVLWIGTRGGLNKFDRNTNTFTRYRHDPGISTSISNDKVSSIYEDQEGFLWIGTREGGLNKFDRKTERFSSYTNNPKDKSSLSNNDVTCILDDKEGGLWIGTYGGGLNKFDRKTQTFTRYLNKPDDPFSLSHNDVSAIYIDHEGVLWIGTRGMGLNQFDRAKNLFIHYKQEARLDSLSHNDVRTIFEDRFQILWIGTRGDGVNKFSRNRNFILYSNDPSNPNSLSHNTVLSILEDESGIFWIGTYGGGLNKFDPNEDKFTRFEHKLNNSESLSDNNVWSLFEDKEKVLWVGTFGGGLNKFDRKTGKSIHYKHIDDDPKSLSNDFVRAIYESRSSGELWIGTDGGGLNKLINRKTGEFFQYKFKENNPSSLSDDRILYIYEDHTGTLWLGTRNGGLNKLVNPGKGEFKRYIHDPEDKKSLSHNNVLCIYEDQLKKLWVGTTGGLNKFDPNTEAFRCYREKDGLPNDVIYGILEDKDGYLWLSTNRGLSKFDPKNEKFKNYDVDDGLQSNEFNAQAFFKSKKGEMYFGGARGFNAFFPAKIKDDINPPYVVITDFLIANQPVRLQRVDKDSPISKPIYATDLLSLSNKQNFFSFEFAALHFASPRKNSYKYKMEGWDENWIVTDAKNRRATYTNLPIGSYTFKVKGSNKDGLWNEDETSIKLKILPPPWKTWWAYSLYSIAGAAILFLIWYIFYQRKKSAYERYVAQVESMAALGTLVSGVAHEINNPSSFSQTSAYNLDRDIINLKAFLIELAGDNADNEIIKAFDERFAVLFKHMEIIKEGTTRINKTVSDLRTFSRIENGEMKPVKLLEGLQITINLVSTQYKDQVEFITDFQCDPDVEGNAAELNRVFMNVMINACQAIIEKQKCNKEIVKGTLTIKTRIEGNEELISFQDTGIGMSEEVKRKIFDPYFTTKRMGEGIGLGLSISYRIIEKHKGDIEVTSKKGVGTKIKVSLPIKDKHFNNYKEETL